MYELFFDTTNYRLAVLLMKDDLITDFINEDKQLKIADEFLPVIDKILVNNNLSLKDINVIYTLIGPGSYMGIRVGITFAKTLLLLNENLKVFAIDSLAFQGNSQDKTISLLDARGNKTYLAIYNDGTEIIPKQVIPNDLLNDFFDKFKDYHILKDNIDLDYPEVFLKLKSQFIYVNNIDELKPLYIKSFI
ncbi:tRNA (adenosine(37)-N6)-threonylcarbamoyltransferase complex dimerization subunit type 1 TsaB [Spiroplasma endosymbiont of Labia minor]|uniref:tRNA (adenosine(37)-N6)-threonylcarbamoyltransferase complex dimerization subunit type 1 TsaB n=1 Tax=Spiroplasma endosymbiont of Labia minor TaxID=3066305 RepID=UPI0030D37322